MNLDNNPKKEIERLKETLAFIDLYSDNPLNFNDAYRLLQSERKLYPDHTTIYGNNLRQTDEKEAKHYKSYANGKEPQRSYSYDDFINNFYSDVSDAIGRLKLEIKDK